MKKTPQLFRFSSNIQLEFAIYGQGKKALICFHGFGQDYTFFENLSLQLTDYQVISINLLFHGKSNRKDETKYLDHLEWKKIFDGLLDQLGIENFSILGYSLGARYVISTLYSFSPRIEHCYLIAPDSIVKRFWYEFATMPLGPQQLFQFFMKNPRPFFLFLRFLERHELMNSWTIRFSRNQLKDPDQRKRVYRSWITLKKLRLSQKKLISLLNNSPFESTFFFGRYDKIIHPKKHFFFLSKLRNSKVLILDTGHAKLLDEAISKISSQL